MCWQQGPRHISTSRGDCTFCLCMFRCQSSAYAHSNRQLASSPPSGPRTLYVQQQTNVHLHLTLRPGWARSHGLGLPGPCRAGTHPGPDLRQQSHLHAPALPMRVPARHLTTVLIRLEPHALTQPPHVQPGQCTPRQPLAFRLQSRTHQQQDAAAIQPNHLPVAHGPRQRALVYRVSP